jgi:predicted Zn finger-like uncharacterized protein
MIIECINCSKKFNIDADLIPEIGRQIQCGTCNHSWFYKVEKTSAEPLILDKKNNQNEDEEELEFTQKDNLQINFENKADKITALETKIIKSEEYIKSKSKKEIKTNSVGNFFSHLIVFIISFVALIILLDTFKSPLINILPSLEIVLFNLFETIKDIKLFIIDLT